MADFLRDLGLEYAKNLPFTLALSVGFLVLAAWGAYIAYEHKAKVELGFCVVAIVATLVTLPWSYFAAKEYCSDLAATWQPPRIIIDPIPNSPVSNGTDLGVNWTYTSSKCGSVWPDGSMVNPRSH